MTARLSYNRPDLRKQINKMKRSGITGNIINAQNAERYAKLTDAELSKKLGRKVRLIEGKRNGKIEIEFYGADDREALIEKLLKL